MNRQQIAKLLPILQAFAEGKEIEYYDNGSDKWRTAIDPSFAPYINYRIKSSTTYRPFANAEECWQEMLKHQPFGWIKAKSTNCYLLLTAVQNIGVYTAGKAQFESEFISCTFADGQPFGIKEEEE